MLGLEGVEKYKTSCLRMDGNCLLFYCYGYIYNKEEVQFSGSYTESSVTSVISTTAFGAHSCIAVLQARNAGLKGLGMRLHRELWTHCMNFSCNA